ncbi:penicillin-binding transpeptidase domain-containing protein [Terriglobus sp. TAA 43]|uniref:penicillin-binding transpeptidase domain-containing protein n=1 Tax=Terriglobus sp. TAA 43 TaxID=278961 RepID=UPI000645B836|nr:penicillin-binding transpeptidase domain-containing protein [Terriglobus sp. TAA 43]
MRFLLVAAFGITSCAGLGECSLQGPEVYPKQVATTGTQTHSETTSVSTNILQDHLRVNKASGVLLDWKTGRLLASVGEQHAATPGSLLKPLVLSYALRRGIVSANTTVYCRRTLHVANRSLPCTHPTDQPMLDAQGALAFSCNTWFASVARRMSAQDLEEVFQQTHLRHSSAQFNDADTRILTALGLEHVSVSPLQIGTAYRALLLHESHTSAVWSGLRDSVVYGMANNARVPGIEVLGKTGTASNAGTWWTHGWFVGAISDRFVLVIYLPHGDGGAAAALAGAVLREFLSEGVR